MSLELRLKLLKVDVCRSCYINQSINQLIKSKQIYIAPYVASESEAHKYDVCFVLCVDELV